jgi:hypothetical protein
MSDFGQIDDPKIAAQVQDLQTQQGLIEAARKQMKSQSPALAVVDPVMVVQSENTPGNNQALLRTINSGFGKIQQSITELQDQILEDPDRAMALDDVRNSTLAWFKSRIEANSDQDRAIAGYLNTKKLQKLGGDVLTGGLTVGAIIGSILAPEAAWPFWVGAGLRLVWGRGCVIITI